jgi:hypothetical protein
MNTKSGTPLLGDWRRRRGTKADAHLFRGQSFDTRPVCLKAIRRISTESVRTGQPCYDCLSFGASGR